MGERQDKDWPRSGRALPAACERARSLGPSGAVADSRALRRGAKSGAGTNCPAAHRAAAASRAASPARSLKPSLGSALGGAARSPARPPLPLSGCGASPGPGPHPAARTSASQRWGSAAVIAVTRGLCHPIVSACSGIPFTSSGAQSCSSSC